MVHPLFIESPCARVQIWNLQGQETSSSIFIIQSPKFLAAQWSPSALLRTRFAPVTKHRTRSGHEPFWIIAQRDME